MVYRVALDKDQCQRLVDALQAPTADLLVTEDSVNLATLVGFLGTRFLPLPPLAAHGRVQGEERDWDVMLVRTTDAYVVLHQLCREGGERFTGPMTVSAHLVLSSKLPFAIENRTTGWPLRVRSALLEIVQWTLDQAPTAPDAPLWRALKDPAGSPRMLEPDTAALRQVLAGNASVQQLWSTWAQDTAAATQDYEQCMGTRALVQSWIRPAQGRGPAV